MTDAATAIETTLGVRPRRLTPMGGGWATVVGAEMPDGGRFVVKSARAGGLEPEGWMLRYLARHSRLPVPTVYHADDRMLVMEWLQSDGRIDDSAQRDAAVHVAALHAIAGPAFGLERDTLIGPLPQPNRQSPRWVDFFRDQRLLPLADDALAHGGLTPNLRHRIDRLAGQLHRWIDEPVAPALIHGDMWSGNVLARNGRISGFIDPAVYYADPEIELAFSTLFGTFGRPFFDRYREIRPFDEGFFEVRCELYNLYPLLVHTRLFGSGYARSVARTLDRLGL